MKRSRSEKHWSHLHRQAEHTAHHSPPLPFLPIHTGDERNSPGYFFAYLSLLHISNALRKLFLQLLQLHCNLDFTSHITFGLIFNDVWIRVQRHDASGKQAFLFSPTFLSIKSNLYQSLSLTGKHSCAINESQFTWRLHQSSCRTGE